MRLLLFIMASLATWQGAELIMEQQERKRKYLEALEYSESVGKPLLVVGGPYGLFGRILKIPAHGCGDVCLDINPNSCVECPNIAIADIRRIPFPDKTFGATFASHVIEHLPTIEDAELAIAELRRVSDMVYVASPRKTNLIAILHPGHHLWVKQVGNDILVQQRNGRQR